VVAPIAPVAMTATVPPSAPSVPVRLASAGATTAPAQVQDIAFTGDDVTGRITIAITGDATVAIGQVSAGAAELIIDHAELAGKLERKLDVSRFGGPVRAVSSFRDRRTPGRIRLVAELASPATPSFDRDAGAIRWNFVGADIAKRPVAVRPAPGAPAQAAVGGFGAASTPIAQQSVAQLPPQASRRRVYHGLPMELHFKDAPIHDLLRLIADVGKVSIVVPDTIDAKVTLDLKRVPWDQALDVILSSHQLWYRREGNIYRIASRKELDTEDEEEAKRREAAFKAESPRSQLIPLNYASAADLSHKLEPMLSPHGKIAVDERTNQLIVTDVAGNRDQIARLAISLDTQTPQISIEARVVEANSTFLRQIGVQWGGRAVASSAGGNSTGLVFPSSVSVIGGNDDAQTIRTGVATPSDFAVNLPAAVGSGDGGALGLSLGSVAGNFNINLRISALEDSGTGRIISAPKITVLNNKTASIASGVSIPISTVSATGTQTQFVQADLRLDVTPSVSQHDCAISMTILVTKNAPDFSNTGARGDPTIQRREARTSMLVADGETSVLGGIYTRNTSLNYRKIPLLGDIPVLGWLFKNRREQDDRTELLVFITPKITNRALLSCK
jgi:type IV pilus assembly protein PilQ